MFIFITALTDIRCQKYIFEMDDSSEKFDNRKRKISRRHIF